MLKDTKQTLKIIDFSWIFIMSANTLPTLTQKLAGVLDPFLQPHTLLGLYFYYVYTEQYRLADFYICSKCHSLVGETTDSSAP